MNEQLAVRTTLRSGDLGRVIELHGRVYDSLDGFGLRFEAFVGCTAIALREDGREQGCGSVCLETTDGLNESQTLYERLGFNVTSDTTAELWDGPRPLIVMELPLA